MEPGSAVNDGLDPHATPPRYLKQIYKEFQVMDDEALRLDGRLTSFHVDSAASPLEGWRQEASMSPDHLKSAFHEFNHSDDSFVVDDDDEHEQFQTSRPAYESTALPGLRLLPSLIPRSTQLQLLSTLLHRDLSNPHHTTNAHLHYHISPPEACHDDRQSTNVLPGYGTAEGSFFSYGPSSKTFLPRDPTIHRAITASKLINRKLRWMTIGGQYDWTSKAYPGGVSPAFPRDIGTLLARLFPKMKAEAAIVNIYSPGDTLSLHRDVSEHSGNDLISLSLGCDAIFVVGATLPAETSRGADRCAVIRLRSGDALCMSGESRFAWHGVPKIVAGTCPPWMRDWPAESNQRFEAWRGWMATKRINLNVRQMFD